MFRLESSVDIWFVLIAKKLRNSFDFFILNLSVPQRISTNLILLFSKKNVLWSHEMPKLNEKSFSKLTTAHSDLQAVFFEVIKYFDCEVITAYRGEEEQNKAFEEKKTQKIWPLSKHNQMPSLAIDVSPLPIDWNDTKRFYYFAGFVKGISEKLKSEGKITHSIRWGGDWDNDTEVKENKFNDLVHFEII